MPMRLTRRPRAAHVVHPLVVEEVRAAWKDLANKSVQTLMGDVSDWREKPEFKSAISMGKVWTFDIKYSKETPGGLHYKFVDKGTAERGGHGQPYLITVKNADMLHFYTPNFPKTLPMDGLNRPITGLSELEGYAGEQADVYRYQVLHPGITPRHFTDSLREQLKPPGPGSFKNVTDAAIKRGLRKIGKKR